MNFYSLIIGLFSLLTLSAALANQDNDVDTTTTTNLKPTPTSVWTTQTVGGVTTVFQTVYSQSFMKTFVDANTDDVKSGAIGVGSASNTLGEIRSYQQTTIVEGAAGHAGVYSGAMGALALVLGLKDLTTREVQE
ncbi:predicted protein [Scheffersomyces stipitis CBS 6054]|uniref:Uncharacterized protein n=1 Tax=Scheffersomyces stipitis (strain ATCC 58785 / CBS 6054 / NBRC 10063 / NRRL Y-11545) TaxID=322104 RepID=A3GIA7_PICST|nr:predicted protein [Scheffersomyces stipitis CBS 6054]EAZ63201.1 predicted protein [Scheffersomyces stipitis CBS 6054]